MLGPNIKGSLSARYNTGGGALRHVGGGAFSLGAVENVGNLTQTSAGTAVSTLSYNQNTYNSVYVDSGKVYPLSLALNFSIKC